MAASSVVARTGMTLSVIGCGTMGSAILSCVLKASAKALADGEKPRFNHFIATVNSAASQEALTARFAQYADILEVRRSENVKAMEEADIILLAFKPYMIDLVLRVDGVQKALDNKLVISVLVGSPSAKLLAAISQEGSDGKEHSEKPIWIKRAMLNIAAEFGESMTVIENTFLSGSRSTDITVPAEYPETTEWIFLQCGKILPVAPELFDVGGVIAGASGAFLSVAFDGMLDGAVKQGLKRADAKVILTQSLFSLAKLLENGHPAVLREKFSSPKGTTIEGLMSLEEDRARYAFAKAVDKSSERSKAIGE